ncbi:hypothetical protein [Galbibacter sp. PAP.153]|uniref:hypothetical protein n=1 Tax=Galbibacter sp. PAP.153 TaxID=3104623 RepID=UPI00300B6F94
MLSELNRNKLIRLRDHFDTILEEGFNLITENSDQFDIYQSLLRRYVYCFESVNTLLKNFGPSKKHRTHSIAIVLRASLLDYLTTLYLRTYLTDKLAELENAEKKYNEQIEILFSEQIRRFLTVSYKDKRTHLYDHEKFCKLTDSLYNNFKHLFDDSKPLNYDCPSKSLKYKRKDDINPYRIRDRLDNYSQYLEKIDYLEVFSLYDVFSKYDHFGVASMALEYFDIDEICENILWSLFHLSDGVSFCVDLLKSETGSNSDFSKFFHEIDCMRGTVYTRQLQLGENYIKKFS